MIEDSSGSADAKFQQAFSLHQQGRLVEARNFYEQVLRAHPAHFNALPRLASLRERLFRAHRGAPLFDTRKLTTDLEKAYQTIQARHQAGLATAHIDIS